MLALAAFAWLYEGRGLIFVTDEWHWIIVRHSPSEASLLEPFNNHWMAVPIAIHQLLYRIVGIGSQVPYRVVLLAVHLTTAWLVYVYLTKRIGAVLALAGTTLFAFYGFAWTVTLWPISLGWAIATACAVGSLLLIERDDRRDDAFACALLLIGVASTSVAVALVVGLGAELALHKAWKRIWVVAVPLVVYAIWYVAYGSSATHSASLRGYLKFIEGLLAQTVGTMLGIPSRAHGTGDVTAGAHVALAVVAIGLVALWWQLGRPHPPRLVALVVSLVVYAGVLAIARASFGLPTSWYSYPAAVLILLIVGELLSGRVAAPSLTAVLVVVTAWAVLWNLGQMRDGGDQFRADSQQERAQLLALDLASERVPRSFTPKNTFLNAFGRDDFRASAYFAVEKDYGTPAYSVEELRDAPHAAQRAADAVLVDALKVRARSIGGEFPAPSLCRRVQRLHSAVVLVKGAGARVGVFDTNGMRISGASGGLVSRFDLPPLADPNLEWVIHAEPGSTVCTLPGSAAGFS